MLRPLFPAALLAAASSSVAAQLPEYEGPGFSEILSEVPSTAEIVDLEIVDLQTDELAELLVLLDDGSLYANLRAVELGSYELVGTGITSIAVAETTPPSALVLDQDGLSQLVYGASGFALLPIGDCTGGEMLRPVMTGPTDELPGVLVSKQGGTAIEFYTYSGGWALEDVINASGEQVQFFDAIIGDWEGDGTDELIVLTSRGFEVIELQTGESYTIYYTLPGVGRLALMPGTATSTGRDYIVTHTMFPEVPGEYLLTGNQDHLGILDYTGAGRPQLLVLENYMQAGAHSLVMLQAGVRSAIVFDEQLPATQDDPIFQSSLRISSDFAMPAGATFQAPEIGCLAGGDYDHDGDADIVFSDNYNRLFFVPGKAVDETLLQVGLGGLHSFKIDQSTQDFTLDLDAIVPAGTTSVSLELYFQAGSAALVPNTPYWTGTFSVSGGSLPPQVSGPLPNDVNPDVPGDRFWLVLHPHDAEGAVGLSRVQAWSPDFSTLLDIAVESSVEYGWSAPGDPAVNGGGPGGTVQRPKIKPQAP